MMVKYEIFRKRICFGKFPVNMARNWNRFENHTRVLTLTG